MTTAAFHSDVDGAVTEDLFRRVMASFVTGVTVITTQVRGEVRGMTANAFMSGSLEPPLCVISVGMKARMHAFLLEAGHFGVNILSRGQEPLIGHFAGRPVEGIDPIYRYEADTPVFARRQRNGRRQSGCAARLRRSFAFCRSYLCVAALRRRHSDRAACRQTRVASAFARANNLADARFLVRKFNFLLSKSSLLRKEIAPRRPIRYGAWCARRRPLPRLTSSLDGRKKAQADHLSY